jgi:GT2 family glycosyltransferase
MNKSTRMLPPRSQPSVAIVTPIFNRIGNLQRFFNSLVKITYPNFTIIIVDDGSTDGSDNYISENHPEAVLLKGNGNLWWAGSTNLGIEWALQHSFDYVLTYNDDQICDPDFLTQLIAKTLNYPRAILASHVYYLSDPRRLVSGGIFIDPKTRKTRGYLNEQVIEAPLEPYEVDCVPGYAVLVPIQAIMEIGPFDNVCFPQIFMELEFCLRARAHGFQIVVVPQSVIWNDREDKHEDPVKEENFKRRWHWFIHNNKSHLNYRQTRNLADVLIPGIGMATSWNRAQFWLRYFSKLMLISMFSKKIRQQLKHLLPHDRDKWA